MIITSGTCIENSNYVFSDAILRSLTLSDRTKFPVQVALTRKGCQERPLFQRLFKNLKIAVVLLRSAAGYFRLKFSGFLRFTNLMVRVSSSKFNPDSNDGAPLKPSRKRLENLGYFPKCSLQQKHISKLSLSPFSFDCNFMSYSDNIWLNFMTKF